ncbi:G-protein coupled receptor 4 [Brachyhypopomus gauderio]|uniref:G-protein coupled receptor 4 n=1 Tax=Brachyhypopomus gauderio TaxID=698409 RepID=UPI0040415089
MVMAAVAKPNTQCEGSNRDSELHVSFTCEGHKIMFLNLTNGSCNFPLETDRVGLTYIYSIAFSLGLPSNLLSLWGLYQLGRSGGGGCQRVYILNLLLSDLLQLLTLPLWILYLQGGHRWPYGSITCQLVGYVFYVNVYASIIFLCLIAVDRCLAIVYPLSSRGLRKVQLAVLSGVVVWTLTFLFCLMGLYSSVFEPQRGLCLEQYPASPRYAYFKIATVALGFLIPCSILGYTSVRIGLTLRSSPSVSHSESHRIMATLTVITIIFMVVFGPYHMVSGYRFVALLLTEDQCALERSIYLCYRICYGLTSVNTLLDPLFYAFLCQDARLKLRTSLPCLSKGPRTHPGLMVMTFEPKDQRTCIANL